MDSYAVVVKKDGTYVSQLAKAHGKFRKCSMSLIIHMEKFHILNFRCLAEP